MQPLVTVIIPTWRRHDLLRECLQSLADQTEQRIRVVVVSNGAGPEAASEAASFGKRHDCQLLTLPANRGFAAGVNAGLEVAKTKYIAVLNDDVRLHPQWLQHLVGWLEEHPETSFATGTILSGDGERVDNLGDAVACSGAAWRLGFGLPRAALAGQAARPLLAASWTAIVLRREAIERVGVLDKNFISYLEDIDFAVRSVCEGLSGRYLPEALCRHEGGASSSDRSGHVFRLMTRNQSLLVSKDFPPEVRRALRSRIRRAGWSWFGLAVSQGRLGAWLAGKASYLMALPAVRRNRLRWSEQGRERLMSWLEAGEAAIYADQFGPHRQAPDAYWRWYFAGRRPAHAAADPAGDSRVISSSSPPRS